MWIGGSWTAVWCVYDVGGYCVDYFGGGWDLVVGGVDCVVVV